MKWDHVKQIFDHLKSIGKVHSQKDFADKLGISESIVSNRLNTLSNVSPSTLLKIRKAYTDIFNDDWLMYGTGDMLLPKKEETAAPTNSTELLLAMFNQLMKRMDERDNLIMEGFKRMQETLALLQVTLPRAYGKQKLNRDELNDPLVTQQIKQDKQP